VKGILRLRTDSLCESVRYAQDDKALRVSEKCCQEVNCGWRGYVVANEGEINVQTMSLLGMLYDIIDL